MEKRSLFHKGKNGETRIWSIWVENDSIYTEYGVLDGEMQIAVRKASPKNVGRKNATTAEAQAIKEAEADYKFKLDRKYSETPEAAQLSLILPMLAKDDLEKIKYPAYIQPKLDGVRCLAFWEGDSIKLISRQGKEWTVPKHINEQVAKVLPKDSMFDGELYIHRESFQTITRYVKKFREKETPTIEYHIYDMPMFKGNEQLDFESRLNELSELDYRDENLLKATLNIKKVETTIISSPEEVTAYEAQCVEAGYEGAIVRNSEGKYLFGYRSSDLIKVKSFQDAEFEVTGCRDGVGKFEGCAVFICKNDKPATPEQIKQWPTIPYITDKDGVNWFTFECNVATSMEERAKQYQERKSYMGRKLTVKFFARTDANLPRFPVGKGFRPQEDLPNV